MSESSDIYKHTQAAEVQERIRIERQKSLADQTEAENHKRRRLESCPHQDNTKRWAFNLVHNFPDNLPRGMCPLCTTIIEPRHYACGGPNEVIVVPEHPLYPVVRWMEHLDYTLAKLEQEYLAQVDGLLGGNGLQRGLIGAAEVAYNRARFIARAEFDLSTEIYKPAAKVRAQ
jgi:hypothetical protein